MTKKNIIWSSGIDIGSTTAKVVIVDKNGEIIFSRYLRHQANTLETIRVILEEALSQLGDLELALAITGSAGMGIAETFELPFIQEMVASTYCVQKLYPDVRTLIEIGGEDSKVVFFDDNFRPSIRMNNSCAGGTGVFIDQMAMLLDVEVSELNSLAQKAAKIYPIASRCGVFAKTDIQALLSRNASKEDIAASIFRSVALQVIAALSKGREIKNKILFAGGPLTFNSYLRNVFADLLDVKDVNELVFPVHAELFPAIGTAMFDSGETCQITIQQLLMKFAQGTTWKSSSNLERLPPLFDGKIELENWKKRHEQTKIPRSNLSCVKGKDLFLGIDSGSTTTKIVLIDEDGRLIQEYYEANHGGSIKVVKAGLAEFRGQFAAHGFQPNIIRTCATGYGENLIKVVFGLDDGVVETAAHYRAARYFEPEVSFILDIGGQDMKAMFIHNYVMSEIHVNEACSSGCGSFIETFSHSLGYTPQEFATIACDSPTPFDLGTRCTVFMNSKIKQAMREGATIPDISAGLAYSVIKNALYKVLQLKNTEVLGKKIVVQGGTFRNPAVLRALELLLNKEVIRPDISELMGAYGAALTALDNYRAMPEESKKTKGSKILEVKNDFTKSEIVCEGCGNRCSVSKLTTDNGNHFYTGNKCERYFNNNATIKQIRGTNFIVEQVRQLFDRKKEPEKKTILTYGIPRCLNMYENFPFWCSFLVNCGFRVVLSSESSFKLYETGISSVMSENICFPAKLAHGHLLDLIEKKVDRVFYPTVVYEKAEFKSAFNSYNCPIVTGYPDLLKNVIPIAEKHGIPFDHPVISFKNQLLLKKQLYNFFKSFGVNYRTISGSVENAILSQKEYEKKLQGRAKSILTNAEKDGRIVVVLAGRAYHMDPLINHGIPNYLAGLGVDVISETAVPMEKPEISLDKVNVLTQWSYTNRLYAVAEWVTQNKKIQLVHLTSFGCGLDAICADEIREILQSKYKISTLIKMDEITNLGAVKLRLRSMLETIKANSNKQLKKTGMRTDCILKHKNKRKNIIVPYFSPFYSPLIPAIFRQLGYHACVLPPQDAVSVELGLKAVNNDMCYPALLIAGDIIKAFKSGKYDSKSTMLLLPQSCGQCRASNYASLIKKSLSGAELHDVSVVTLSADEIDAQTGFEINEKGLVKRTGFSVIFADALLQMYLSTKAREKVSGAAKEIHSKYLSAMEIGIENADYHSLLNTLKQAIVDFNMVEISNKPTPKIGIAGEIFVKYNLFAQCNLIEWLSEQKIEVLLPPLQNFFMQHFVNETYNQKVFLKRSFADRIKYGLLEFFSKSYFRQVEKAMLQYRFYQKPQPLKRLAKMTDKIISLANQSGEGWLLTAEIIAMLKEGVDNIVCLQPFGCISNQITGAGMEKKLKTMFPSLNFLSLDLDAGVSEVNILNRLHFMIMDARKQMTSKVE